jgi:hypothetical protein
MLLLNKNLENKIVLTLTEKLTEITLLFHFIFTNDYSGQKIEMSLEDESTYPLRYNWFSIDDTDFNIGFYSYSVEDDAGNILETGKLLVKGEEQAPIQYSPNGTTINNIVYDKNE